MHPRQLAPRLDLEPSLRRQNDRPRAYAMPGLREHRSPSMGVRVGLRAWPVFRLREQPGSLGGGGPLSREQWQPGLLGAGWVCVPGGWRVTNKVKGTHTRRRESDRPAPRCADRETEATLGKAATWAGSTGQSQSMRLGLRCQTPPPLAEGRRGHSEITPERRWPHRRLRLPRGLRSTDTVPQS